MIWSTIKYILLFCCLIRCHQPLGQSSWWQGSRCRGAMLAKGGLLTFSVLVLSIIFPDFWLVNLAIITLLFLFFSAISEKKSDTTFQATHWFSRFKSFPLLIWFWWCWSFRKPPPPSSVEPRPKQLPCRWTVLPGLCGNLTLPSGICVFVWEPFYAWTSSPSSS